MTHANAFTKAASVAATALLLGVLPAGAVGSDSGGSETPPQKTQTTTQCKKDEIYDAKQDKCVKVEKSSMNDDQKYDAARELAWFGRPEEAIAILSSLGETDRPNVQNYLGFAHRKAGRLDAAMVHYARALSLDPDYVLARSYMGQGLIAMGDIDGAKMQLAEIRRRAGTVNYAYVALDQALRTVNPAY